MTTAARIDELRKKFEENPRRYFAPLANELRKAGNLSEAIALCREFLPKQPEHMSGFIVFGQALYESGDLPEARAVFGQALALDPENLKALRHLGDIAKWEGDTVGARRWYERVLDADPRNDDIAAQLATLATPAYVSRVVPEPPSSPVSAPVFSAPPVFLGAIPTPDAALRAVDLDEISARLRGPDEPSPARVETPLPTAPAPAAPDSDLLDLEAVEDVADAGADTEAAVKVVEAVVADDPFGFSETVTEEVPFEEGLIAPEWPDTSVLVARGSTPRPASPTSPLAMAPDVVEAFGLESGDPIPSELIEADAHAEATLMTGAAHDFRLADDVSVADAAEGAVEVEGELATEVEQEAGGDAADEPQPTAHGTPIDEALDPLANTEPEWIVAAPSAPAPTTDDDFPWLAPAPEPLSVVDSIEIDVATFLRSATPVEDVVEPAAPVLDGMPDVSALFMDGGDDSDDAAYESDSVASGLTEVIREEPAPAFVTETMGELLVSQGFTARAVTVYEELVRRRPYDPVLTSRLAELRERLSAESAPVTPAFPTPAFPTPAFPAASFGTPAVGTPAFVGSVTPPYATPLSATPISSPAYHESLFADDSVDRVTARERFSRLALRRVPRRTPPRTAVAVDPLSSQLVSLFGAEAPEHDDRAARALAEAFAPIDESGHVGSERPFEEAMFGGADRAVTPTRSATPMTTTAVSDPAGLFSFDRFFPDPATSSSHAVGSSEHRTPAPEPTSEPLLPSGSPTVSDDLAEFSEWLKGLGNP
jgi:hypothetical protein